MAGGGCTLKLHGNMDQVAAAAAAFLAQLLLLLLLLLLLVLHSCRCCCRPPPPHLTHLIAPRRLTAPAPSFSSPRHLRVRCSAPMLRPVASISQRSPPSCRWVLVCWWWRVGGRGELCTDVAAQGLDFPAATTIVQGGVGWGGGGDFPSVTTIVAG